ncbi:Lactose operon repressor [Klebsiella pneumoniae]|nr:Lactose operon repressor [Klebsiella pneumoniae]
MRAITESAARVGADISVVGYDDTEDSSCYIPPLTTIKQDFRLLGKTSVDRLLKLSQGRGEEQSAVARLTGEKKTTLPPNTQTTSPARWQIPLMQLARQVSDLKAGSERNAINVSQLTIRHPRLYTLCVRLVCYAKM